MSLSAVGYKAYTMGIFFSLSLCNGVDVGPNKPINANKPWTSVSVKLLISRSDCDLLWQCWVARGRLQGGLKKNQAVINSGAGTNFKVGDVGIF